jgi:DNA-binding Lrp family transcriptional regulator
VLVNVDLTRKDRATFEAFEAAAAALDEVIEIRRMFGLPDYVLRVAIASIESYETLVSTGLNQRRPSRPSPSRRPWLIRWRSRRYASMLCWCSPSCR